MTESFFMCRSQRVNKVNGPKKTKDEQNNMFEVMHAEPFQETRILRILNL